MQQCSAEIDECSFRAIADCALSGPDKSAWVASMNVDVNTIPGDTQDSSINTISDEELFNAQKADPEIRGIL